jgi:hypothetical protein
LRGYSKGAPLEYAEFALCREMGWTFNELEEQPTERIEQAFLFIERENIYRKSQENSD